MDKLTFTEIMALLTLVIIAMSLMFIAFEGMYLIQKGEGIVMITSAQEGEQ